MIATLFIQEGPVLNGTIERRKQVINVRAILIHPTAQSYLTVQSSLDQVQRCSLTWPISGA